MKMNGNTILITGGTSGIGRSLAKAFYKRGNRVIITGRRQALLDEVTAICPGIIGVPLDLNDSASLSRLTQRVRECFPELNVLLANAGISQKEDLAADNWDISVAETVVDTNILGVLRVVAALLPTLKRNEDAVIMATTSNLAFVPRASFPTYCATKAFLHSWLQSLRYQLRKVPVEVLELAPPYVQTELSGQHQSSDPRAMPLTAYVAEVMQLLESRDYPENEVLVQRARGERSAEREGRYDSAFAVINPA